MARIKEGADNNHVAAAEDGTFRVHFTIYTDISTQMGKITRTVPNHTNDVLSVARAYSDKDSLNRFAGPREVYHASTRWCVPPDARSARVVRTSQRA